MSKLITGRGDQAAFAKRLGADPGHISRVLRGLAIPGLKLRQVLWDKHAIPMQSWDEPPRGEATDAAE